MKADESGTGSSVAALLQLADELRPELHRYCARLMGSVIEGEDVVQDTFVRAFAAFEELGDTPPLRAWLFKIAHNRALDLLRSRKLREGHPLEATEDLHEPHTPDPLELMMREEAIGTAVSRFTELPTLQRSAVILKDVLDHSLEEIASLLELTVDAVKGHLARGRVQLEKVNARHKLRPPGRAASSLVRRYVDLFNRHDWEALRALLADDVRLVQSSHPPRAGVQDVGMFFGLYSRNPPARLATGWLEDREVIAVFTDPSASRPSYLMWLDWCDGKISFIRDYKYVRYVIDDAELVLTTS